MCKYVPYARGSKRTHCRPELMILFHGTSKPSLAPNTEAVAEVPYAATLAFGGERLRFQGDAFEWDTRKARTVALTFDSPWFSQRQMDFLIWADAAANVEVSCDAFATVLTASLTSEEGLPVASKLTNTAVGGDTGLTSQFRVFLIADVGTSVWIGLNGGKEFPRTQLRWNVVPDLHLAVFCATWIVALAALMLVGFATGVKAVLLGAPAMAVLPWALKSLGVSWAGRVDVSTLALWIARNCSRWVQRTWIALGLPAALLVVYLLTALSVYGVYCFRVQQVVSQSPNVATAADLFCNYPERIEVRALLARAVHSSTGSRGRANAYSEATGLIPLDHFRGTCLYEWRLTPFFIDVPPSRNDDARIFYASMWWNAINDWRELPPAEAAIWQVLSGRGELARLTLAKYELLSLNNRGEQIWCDGAKASSPDCASKRKECANARKRLIAAIEKEWTVVETHTVTYLEAHDALAFSYTSTGCDPSGPKDEELAVRYLRALLGAMPRGEVVLDNMLTQFNFRKYLDAQWELNPDHPTAVQWKKDCALRPTFCQRLHDTFINDGKQTFFSSGREQRAREWDSPSLPALNGEALERRIESLTKKDWKWPLN